jgi:dihydrodipicolinate synthase/N-acetylneuraminate lyase
VIVALLTPFDDDGRLDEAALRAHVDDLVKAGVDGLMPCGTTGEGALLSDDELVGVVRATCQAAGGRVPVLAHVGRPGTWPTLELGRRAIEGGAAAVSAVVPYYYAVGSEDIRAHYAALVEGLDGTPVYGYTIPERTHNELEPALVGRLVDDGLAGMKDSTQSIERHREYAAEARRAGGSFALFMGTAGLVLDALREGSAGAVLALANLHPELCVGLVRAHREGDENEADRLQAEMAAREEELGRDALVPALKHGVGERLREHGARYGTAMRAPFGAGGRVAAHR